MEELRRERITARGPNCNDLSYLRDVALHPTKHPPDSRGGQFCMLTDSSFYYEGNMILQEGDTICYFQDSSEYFVLRRARETYWTLVGHIQQEFLRRHNIRLRFVDSKEQLFKLK